MRNMSFALTTQQYQARTKTVTRRLGWKNLKAGDQFMGVLKGMGLKKGEKVTRLHASECVSNRSEPLNWITKGDCAKEGFPHLSPSQFVEMFCRHNGCREDTPVNRIEFRHL
jgi:hypothetical protein